MSVEWIGNQKHYRANRNSPIFTELQSIILKTAGLAEPLRQSLVPYADRIKVAFVYGSVAKGSDTAQSDIDLMVVGEDLSYADLFTALQKADETLQRNVNRSFLSVDEWRRKISQTDSVIAKINTQPKIFIFGSEADLQA